MKAEQKIKEVFLKNMGKDSFAEINEWFRTKYNIGGMKVTAELIAAQPKDRKIIVCGDYDVDGVTGTSILIRVLNRFGFTNVSYLIPYRVKEGYGLNFRMVESIPSKALVICVDNGIACFDQIYALKNKKCDVVVLDHHAAAINEQTGDKRVPVADIVIDPEAFPEDSDFDAYCGASLAYNLAIELMPNDKEFLYKLTALATFATIADVMPLREYNYALVYTGLRRLVKKELNFVGVNKLLEVLKIGENETPIAKDISHGVAPVINAASRMDDEGFVKCIDLFTTDDYGTAERLVDELVKINEERKDIQNKSILILQDAINQFDTVPCPFVYYQPGLKEGIVGILAGKICEEYKVPTILLTDSEKEGEIKGSGRSIEGYDLKKALDIRPDLFIAYGGHPLAAGMTLFKSDFDELKHVLQNDFEKKSYVLNYESAESTVLNIDDSEISEAIQECAKYEPWGEGNIKPQFTIEASLMSQKGEYVAYCGATNDTVRMKTNQGTTLLGFHKAESFLGFEPRKVRVQGDISNNWWRGNCTPQLLFDSAEILA